MTIRAYRVVVARLAAGTLAAMCLAACGTTPDPGPAVVPVPRRTTTRPPASVAMPATPQPPAITYPAHGHGKWTIAARQDDAPAGNAGRLLRYRVLVERDITGLPVSQFADAVAATLGDPQGWTAGGRWRFRRVGAGRPYDFTIFLATPDTRDRLCDNGSDGYTSCRNGDDVVLNVARWVKGVPGYGAGLPVYRSYMVNHEVGHRLGRGHELCPGEGEPAPVMQQQTLGLHGCEPNAWPYLDGESYTGRSGAYDDPSPDRDEGLR
jgi:uncharacterized protein DUF3152